MSWCSTQEWLTLEAKFAAKTRKYIYFLGGCAWGWECKEIIEKSQQIATQTGEKKSDKLNVSRSKSSIVTVPITYQPSAPSSAFCKIAARARLNVVSIIHAHSITTRICKSGRNCLHALSVLQLMGRLLRKKGGDVRDHRTEKLNVSNDCGNLQM